MSNSTVKGLKAIESKIDQLIEDKTTSRDIDEKTRQYHREYNQRYYVKKGASILNNQKKKREEMRAMAVEETKKARKEEPREKGLWDKFQDKTKSG